MSGAVSRLGDVELPDFGMPEAMPVLADSVYLERIEELRARADERGYQVVVVYADREHSANISYLTGFDPRFEEAMLVVSGEGDPAVLVGNENEGTAGAAPLPMRVRLFQDFSLPNQPRDRSLPLDRILAEEGVDSGTRVGVVGWKTFPDRSTLDVPSYIADCLRGLAGTDSVENATDLLIDASSGMRVINEVEQLAVFEYAACQTSNGVRNLLFELKTGMTEQEAVSLLRWNGAPLSCHLMLTAGERARFGLLSPSDRPIGRGEPLTVAFGIWGRSTAGPGSSPRAQTISPTTSPTTWTCWCGHISRPLPGGTGPCISVRRAGCCRRSSTEGWATPSSASSSTLATRSISTNG
jgi:Xaa-Pro aminopeptidase